MPPSTRSGSPDPLSLRPGLGPRTRRLRLFDRIFHAGSAATATLLLLLIAGIAAVLAWGAGASLARFGPRFLSIGVWDPVHGIYGAYPAIAGTLLTSALALLFAVPVSLGVAIFIAELAPRWLRESLAVVVDLSAAVPSVVFGFWGYLVVAPYMKGQVEPTLALLTGGAGPFSGAPSGSDVLTASLVLAIMIIPTISALSRAALLSVPRMQREAALSLGSTRWESVRLAVLGPARSGIAGGILIGLGRAVGETMVVTMTIGNIYQVPRSLFSQGQSIASQIVSELGGAGPAERAALLELGLVLLALTIAINVGARLLLWRLGPSGTPAATAPGRRTVALRAVAASAPGSAAATGVRPPFAKTSVPPGARPGSTRSRRRWIHRTVVALAIIATGLAIAPLASVIGNAAGFGGAAVVTPSFYTNGLPSPCNSGPTTTCPLGGVGPALEGTLILLGLAAAIALPIGLLAGIYLSEYGRHRFARAVSFFTDVMVGIPSILIGLFVYVFLVASAPDFSQTALSGAAALSILMVPIVTRATEESLRLVPVANREAALAIGFPKHRVTLRVVLGSARGAVLTGILLALARAGGETAALVFTAFGNPYWFQGLGQPIGALPLVIYNEGVVAHYTNWQSDAWGAMLILLALMLLLSLVARLAFRDRAAPAPGGA